MPFAFRTHFKLYVTGSFEFALMRFRCSVLDSVRLYRVSRNFAQAFRSLVNLGGMRNGGIVAGCSYHLLGIVSGYYLEDADFKLTAATTVEGTLHANSGIALAVPAYELRALLDSPILQEARDAVVRAVQIKK